MPRPRINLPPLHADPIEATEIRLEGDEIWEVWSEVKEPSLGCSPVQIVAAYLDRDTAERKARTLTPRGKVIQVRRRAARFD